MENDNVITEGQTNDTLLKCLLCAPINSCFHQTQK